MKKLLSFVSICIMAAVLITGCNKPDNELDLSISSSATSVKVGEKIGFTVTSTFAPTSDLTINVESDNPAIATVPATVTMKKDEKTAAGEITGIAKGDANITISANGVNISTKSVKITVTEDAPEPEVVKLTLATAASQVTAGETMKFTVTTPVAPESDLTVNVTSSNPAAATVPASVVLKAGEKSVEGEITGVAEGKTTITIAADGVEIAVASKEITVAKAPVLELTIASSKSIVTIGSTLQFTISTPVAPNADISLSLNSSNPEFVSLAEETLILAAGQKSVTGTLNGVAEGTSTISFTASPETDIVVGSISITAEILRPLIGIIGSSPDCYALNPWVNTSLEYEGTTYWNAGLFYQNREWGNFQGDGSVYKNSLESYGCDFVGELHNGYGVFKAIEAGTAIDENLEWFANQTGGYPAFYKTDGFTLGDGEHYIVTKLRTDIGKPESYRAWIKVKINGPIVSIVEGAACLNDAPFTVGQK